ncbi:MAG: MFS transporter [Dehalococcoidia bacterium]|nr:MFS transporter [Dehalococcoidia bacterium]
MTTDKAQSKKRIYYGWWVVFAACIYHALFGGLYHTGISLYFLPFKRAFSITSTQLSVAFAVRSLEGGLEGPFVGYLVDKVGPRPIVWVGLLCGGFGFILLGLTQTFPMFLVVFLGFLTIGFSTPFHGITASINYWFSRRLGTAMSLGTLGSAIGGVIVTPFVAWLIFDFGWRFAATASGVLILVVGIPLSFLIRVPKGDETEEEDQVADNSKEDQISFDGDFTIREALHTKAYWLLSLSIGLRLMAQSALMVHMVPMLVSKSNSETVAAMMVALLSLVRFPAIIGAGIVSDKWVRTKTSAIAMMSGVAAGLVILFGPDGIVTAVLFAVLFAGAQSCNSVTWALVGQFFGRKNFGALRGGVTLVQSLMSTIGPLGAGIVFDTTGDYKIAFFAIAATYFAATLMFWTLKAPPVPLRTDSVAQRIGMNKTID